MSLLSTSRTTLTISWLTTTVDYWLTTNDELTNSQLSTSRLIASNWLTKTRYSLLFTDFDRLLSLASRLLPLPPASPEVENKMMIFIKLVVIIVYLQNDCSGVVMKMLRRASCLNICHAVVLRMWRGFNMLLTITELTHLIWQAVQDTTKSGSN
jgi:hypothetical protein